MRPFTSTVPFADALRLALDAARPIERTEVVAVDDADGRVLAEDAVARGDVPPFDRSAMDGYAVRAADTVPAGPPKLPAQAEGPALRGVRCVGRVHAGEAPARAIAAGECMEIATGAPLPAGADAVVMVERSRLDGEMVLVLDPVSAGQNVGRRGGDMRAGEVIVPAGQPIDPARAGAMAATGVDRVAVYARPSVALVSTGNEVRPAGQPLGPGQIHDINRVTLAGIVRRHGGMPVALPLVGDSLAELGAALDAALAHDLVVLSGGSSVGSRDLVRDAVGTRGQIVFHGIAVKPGKPTLFAIADGVPIFGMPGNPTSCLSNGYMLLAPFLRRMARLPAWTPRTAHGRLARAIRSVSDRHQFYTVRLSGDLVEPAFKGSGEITSMAHADGYIEIAAGTDNLPAGTMVTVTLLGGSGLEL
jgi:molybdopterin molybdotransferase